MQKHIIFHYENKSIQIERLKMDIYAFHMCLPVHKETPNLDGTVQGESQTTEITH